jgi:2-phosphosulfolactate phosphatase
MTSPGGEVETEFTPEVSRTRGCPTQSPACTCGASIFTVRPMNVDVILLPAHLQPGQLRGRTVVVFDVLRATTTMTAGLAAGLEEIRVFGTLQAARDGSQAFDGAKVLCGEVNCLKPEGFALGNSPRQFEERHRGLTAFMSTTNGTRAILAARDADAVFVAALVNARRAAAAVAGGGREVTLLCAGTQGQFAMEDVLGAGAVLQALVDHHGHTPAGDTARMAMRLFAQARHDLPAALRETDGGRNVFNAGLTSDIDFAARLDALDAVGIVQRVSNIPSVRTFV